MIKELDFLNVYRDVIRTLSDIYDRAHCVKSVQIQSYFWSVFSCIWIEYEDLRRFVCISIYREGHKNSDTELFITLHMQLKSDLKGIERYHFCDTCWSGNADELFLMNSSATTCSRTVRHVTVPICVTIVYLCFLPSGRVLTHSPLSWLLRFHDFLGNAHPLTPSAKKHDASMKKVGKNSPFHYPILNTIMLWQ